MNPILETLYPNLGQWFEPKKILFETKSEHQSLVIFEHEFLGRVLMLDGVVQTTSKDEFIYHEMMAHVPLFSHPNPTSVLIIGGGDGGLLREVLKHPSITRVLMIEIDPKVIELCQKYLPNHSQGSFDDPRLELIFGDGAKVVCEISETFDVILSDSTDPEGPAEGLFESSFYKNISLRLKKGGVFVAQNGVPFLQPKELQNSHQRMQKSFKNHGFYTLPVPTYYGGLMTLAMASDESLFFEPNWEQLDSKFESLSLQTQYYTPKIHQGSFALPPFIQLLLKTSNS